MTKYFSIFLLLFSSCYYDNQEELYQYLVDNCDTTSITFSNSIMPIIIDECSSCHLSGNTLGEVSLNSYSEVMIYVDNGELESDINGTANIMPKAGMMNNCNIMIIEKWINDGAKNN
ncbi:MAG: hypothetical protein H8E84_07875 [Flavobacteriales bacterium]|nr:hypothetical protein [Flavobacteriales bacterium]